MPSDTDDVDPDEVGDDFDDFDDPFDDDDFDDPFDDADEEVQDARESRLGGFIGSLPRLIPRQSKVFRAMAMKSLKGYYKRSGGDALGLDARAGQQLDLVPIKYRSADECDTEAGEKPGWVAKGSDKTWNAASEGRVVDYLGDTPVVALDHDSHVECGWLRPRIGEAIELDNYDGVYTRPQIEPNLNVYAAPDADGGLATDGGQADNVEMQLQQLALQDPGRWAGDALIDLDSGDGYDGMRVSFRKATEWQSETTSTQEMQMQEDRGYLRGKAGTDGPSMTKLLLICAAIILGSLAIFVLGPELVGSGGGGGGGINPLMIAPGLL